MRMLKSELMGALNALPDDCYIIPQVVGEESGAWGMLAHVSGVVPHIKWDLPAAVLTLSHPRLRTLPEGAFEND